MPDSIRRLAGLVLLVCISGLYPSLSAQVDDFKKGLQDPVTPDMYSFLRDDEMLLTGNNDYYEVAIPEAGGGFDYPQILPADKPPMQANDTYHQGPELFGARFLGLKGEQAVRVYPTSRPKTGDCWYVHYVIEVIEKRHESNPTILKADSCLQYGAATDLSPYGAAAGDLDRSENQPRMYLDEIVVAVEQGSAADGAQFPSVAVFSNHGSSIESTSLQLDYRRHPINRIAYPVTHHHGIRKGALMKVTTFDVAGRGQKRIALLHSSHNGNEGGFTLNILGYDRPADGGAARLRVQAKPLFIPGSNFWVPADMAAGDFDGDGREEIAIARVAPNGKNAGFFDHHGLLEIYEYQPSRGVVEKAAGTKFTDVLLPNSKAGPRHLAHEVALTPGMFHWDPPNGDDLSRRQIAVSWYELNEEERDHRPVRVWSAIYGMSEAQDDQGSRTSIVYKTAEVSAEIELAESTDALYLDSAAGNFGGYAHYGSSTVATADQMAWRLMVVSSTRNLGSDHMGAAIQYRVKQAPENNDLTYSLEPYGPRSPSNYPHSDPRTNYIGARVAALDWDGDAMVLGSPRVLEISKFNQLSLLLMLPPQHADYLPNHPLADPRTGMVNVSRDPSFAVTFSERSTNRLSNANTSTTQWGVGLKQSLDLKSAIKVGELTEEITGLGGQLSTKFAERFQWGWDNSRIKETSTKYSVTQQVERSTNTDDVAFWISQTQRLWIYPIHGLDPLENRPPGERGKALHVLQPVRLESRSGGGLQMKGYQPLHEPGNLLSYRMSVPSFSYPNGPHALPDTPRDWGNSNLPIAGGPTVKQKSVTLGVGGTDGSDTITFTKETDTTQKQSWNHKFEGGVDLTGSVGITFGEPLITGEAKNTLQGSIGGFGNGSMGNLHTWSNGVQVSESLSVNVPAAKIPNASYSIEPHLYMTATGYPKLSFDVRLAESELWSRVYNAADPALNLPYRVRMEGGTNPTLNTSPDANEMRGFFVRNADTADDTGLGNPLPSPTRWDRNLQLDARIYNYSTGKSFESLKARFEIFALDSNGLPKERPLFSKEVTAEFTDEYGLWPPNPMRPSLFPPLGVGRAILDINPSEVLPAIPRHQSRRYRVVVVLDPDNEIRKETHEWRIAGVLAQPTFLEVGTQGMIGLRFRPKPEGSPIDVTIDVGVGGFADPTQKMIQAINDNQDLKSYGISAEGWPHESTTEIPVWMHISTPYGTYPFGSDGDRIIRFSQPIQGAELIRVDPIQQTLNTEGYWKISNVSWGQNNQGFAEIVLYRDR